MLAVLGTVVAYDLTQTSEDPWSLRVYRGEEEGCLITWLTIFRSSSPFAFAYAFLIYFRYLLIF